MDLDWRDTSAALSGARISASLETSRRALLARLRTDGEAYERAVLANTTTERAGALQNAISNYRTGDRTGREQYRAALAACVVPYTTIAEQLDRLAQAVYEARRMANDV